MDTSKKDVLALLREIKTDEPGPRTIVVQNAKKERLIVRIFVGLACCLLGNLIWNFAPVKLLLTGIAVAFLGFLGWELKAPQTDESVVAQTTRGYAKAKAKGEEIYNKVKDGIDDVRPRKSKSKESSGVTRKASAKVVAVKAKVDAKRSEIEDKINRIKSYANNAKTVLSVRGAVGAIAQQIGEIDIPWVGGVREWFNRPWVSQQEQLKVRAAEERARMIVSKQRDRSAIRAWNEHWDGVITQEVNRQGNVAIANYQAEQQQVQRMMGIGQMPSIPRPMAPIIVGPGVNRNVRR